MSGLVFPSVDSNLFELKEICTFEQRDLAQQVKEAICGHCVPFESAENSIFSFLSNDYPSTFEFGGLYYTSATAAYEAQKFSHRPDLMHRFTTLDARQALTLSAEEHFEKHFTWYDKREETMYHVLRAKFGQNPDLCTCLLATDDTYLSFHTSFKAMDPFWTDDADGSGANRLGHLLMAIREYYGGKGEVPRPEGVIGHEEIQTCALSSLDKSNDVIREEIDTLNAAMDPENYCINSQTARDSSTHSFTRFPSNNFPYDQTLVTLSSGRFINANLMLDKQYIGTQSPMPSTNEDFWSMVIEYHVPIVIMLNRRGDPGDDIYFPLTQQDVKQYGNIRLELMEEPLFTTEPSWRRSSHEEEPHAIIHRKLKICCGDEVREVDHFQYQNWRDFFAGNERAAAYLVKTVDVLRKEKTQGPVVVHCHAGVGRTSVMITLLDQYKNLSTDQVDIKRSVEQQRSPEEGRCHSMMQSSDQYAFCYRVLRLLL